MVKTKIRVVYLNNKSRKGFHIYLRAKGETPVYYKVKDDVPLDTYRKYYEDKITGKKKGTLRQYESAFTKKDIKKKIDPKLNIQVNRYIKKMRKKGNVEKSIKGGIRGVILRDIHKATDTEIRQRYKDLFSPLVLDARLLDLLTLEENISKLRKRFEFRSSLIRKDGTSFGSVNHMGEKTLRQVITELTRELKVGMSFSEISNGVKDLGKIGYSYSPETSNGELSRIDTTIIFRKR